MHTAIAVPMANNPPFATLNHVAGDLGIPSKSALLRIGISYEFAILAGGDYFTHNNSSALGLIRSLGENGVIRIGGNSSEPSGAEMRSLWGLPVS